MMSLNAIEQLSREAAVEASARKLEPYVPWDAEEIAKFGRDRQFPFPFLGDRIPEGWRRYKKRWFADSSGLGAEDEPAMTPFHLAAELSDFFDSHPGCGFAVSEAGQFQCYVSAYRRVR